MTFTNCGNIDLWSLRLREASPNVFGRKWPEWDRTLQSTESSCLPLRDARLPFPPVQGPPPTVEVCLWPPWGRGGPQPMKIWLGSCPWSDQAQAPKVRTWPGCRWRHTWAFNHCPFWAVGLKRQVCVTPVIPGILLLRMYFWEILASLS